jgi:branched-chain amino acid transport system substrate-binding protein
MRCDLLRPHRGASCALRSRTVTRGTALLRKLVFKLGPGLVLSLVASLVLAAPATADSTPREPIRLGLIEAMSGPFASSGAVVQANLEIAIAAINQSGGVQLADGRHSLELVVADSRNSTEEALLGLTQMSDRGVRIVLQGNSSAVAAALVDGVERHNQRLPEAPMLYLNYSAVDPALTNQHCSFWHFRFDASADMRMNVLTDVMQDDSSIKRLYLINQDYVFGHQVAASARRFLADKRPDIEVVGEAYHPIGQVRDFAPYIAAIAATHADAVVTGNWGPDLSLLVKAAREANLKARFFTFYGDSLGAPLEMGAAGVDRVLAVAEWNANAGPEALAAARRYREHFTDPRNSYQFLRIEVMVRMLATALEQSGRLDARRVALALEDARFANGFYSAHMRRIDHQVEEPLIVSRMVAVPAGSGLFDQEGSGFGFVPVKTFDAAKTTLPTSCNMQRPAP